jgi:magnesium transporter
VLFAPWFLGEKISRNDILATSLIVVGCVVAVSMGSHDDPVLSLDQLFALYRTATFAVYASCIAAVIIGILIAIRVIEGIEKKHGKTSPEYLRFFKFHRFSYSCISGFIGAQSVLFAKTLVGLLTDSVRILRVDVD